MMPMEPGPEACARLIAERRAQMERARAIAYFAHSRSGRLFRYPRRLAGGVDPTGRARRKAR